MVPRLGAQSYPHPHGTLVAHTETLLLLFAALMTTAYQQTRTGKPGLPFCNPFDCGAGELHLLGRADHYPSHEREKVVQHVVRATCWLPSNMMTWKLHCRTMNMTIMLEAFAVSCAQCIKPSPIMFTTR
jgi:hypothetical protein